MTLKERSYPMDCSNERIREVRVGRFTDQDQQRDVMPLDRGEFVGFVTDSTIVAQSDPT